MALTISGLISRDKTSSTIFAVASSVTDYITAETGSSLYSTYLIVGAYILSGLLLLIIVKAADPNEGKS